MIYIYIILAVKYSMLSIYDAELIVVRPLVIGVGYLILNLNTRQKRLIYHIQTSL